MKCFLLLYLFLFDCTSPLTHTDSFTIDPDLFSWLPLSKGNTWFLTDVVRDELPPMNYKIRMEVTGLHTYGDKTYHVVESKTYDANDSLVYLELEYYRVDSLSGRIWRTGNPADQFAMPNLYVDLSAQQRDTIISHPRMVLFEEKEITFAGFDTKIRKYISGLRKKDPENLPLGNNEFQLLKGIGFYSSQNGSTWFRHRILVGAVISGKVYGDTIP